MSLFLHRLRLSEFRSYRSLVWRPEARISVLFGPNGSGKTNLLEAMSLLVPGRGLRGARPAELYREGGDAGGHWAVAGRFATSEGPVDIGTGTSPDGPPDRRIFRLDRAPPRTIAEVSRRVAAVWLTPQMDRLFQEGTSGRRRFLDRLVWALEPSHASEVAAHDAAIAGRNRLLAGDRGGDRRGGGGRGGGGRGGGREGGRTDAAWLASIEDAVARHAVAATAARAGRVARLNAAVAAGAASPFPEARLALVCPIADRLAAQPALAVEDWLRDRLAEGRVRDAAAGAAAFGAHRTDFAMTDAATGLPAGRASTGQQKAMLVGTVLGHAALIAAARGFAPLLLLDEPAVHLDPDRRRALFDALGRLPGQAVLTGTDAETFHPLRERAQAWRTGDGALREDAGFLPVTPVCGTL